MTRITEINHPSHDHPLVLESPNEPYHCDGCRELGFGPCYHCKFGCNFHLHHECAAAPPSASHPFFRGCKFAFHHEAHRRVCDACGNDALGFLYQCQHERAHDLHPCCLKLQREIVSQDGVRLRLTDRVSSKCLRCGSKEASNGIRGWSYESSCGRFCYHVACVKDLVLENFRNNYVINGRSSYGGVEPEAYDYLAFPNISTSSALARTSTNGSIFGEKARKFWKMAKMVLRVIISAIFGDPSAGVVFLIESLIS